MKKLYAPLLFGSIVMFAACGGEQEEHKIRFGTERSEIGGNPRSMVHTSIDYEGVPAGGTGDTISVEVRYYNQNGDVITYEYFDHIYEDEDYTQTYEYDENNRLTGATYTDHADADESFWTVYTWKGGMISKVENFDEDGLYSYYKYTYKGNKEISSSLYSGIGIKRQQTDTTWDGDRVVKQVRKSDGSEIVYTVEYPDANTEVITVDGFGPEDEGLSYEMRIVFDEHGNFKTFATHSEDTDTETLYSYEHDNHGNWVKRTVTDSEGNLMRVEIREFTY